MTKGEQTRRKIVEAAAPIFNKCGYEGSSLSGLMEATGLKKGGIYRHFSSKEELAAEVFDYTWEAAWSARLVHVDDKANGIEKLKQLIANFIDHRSPVAGGCAFWRPTGMQRHSQSLAIWIPKSSAFFEGRRTVTGDK